MAGCAPQTSADSTTQIVERSSKCISPSTSTAIGVDATLLANSFNANTSNEIADLEYLLSEINSEYACGSLFQETGLDILRGVRVYELATSEQRYVREKTSLENALARLSLPATSRVVLLVNLDGTSSLALAKTGWSGADVETQRLGGKRESVYSQLASGNRSVFLSNSGRASNETRDTHNCADFASQAAAQLFFNSMSGDFSRLDSDNDGVACESLENSSASYRVVIDSPTPALTRTATPPSSASSGRCYVNSYTRSNGTRVSGYYRRC